MENKVYKYITEHSMIMPGDNVLVGLSGGADSVCLLMVLLKLKEKLGVKIRCAHVNHMIRGEEALRDEKFCEKLCKDLGVALEVFHVDVPKLSSEGGLSLEEAGRSARYKIFEELCDEKTRIATAHHGNDQAETVIHNLVRGSGLRGIGGMRPVNGRIVRPLLCVTRSDIEGYLNEIDIDYVTDSTNESLEYMRNKLRHVVLPYLANEINADAISNISEAAKLMSEADEYLVSVAKDKYNSVVSCENGQYLLDVKGFGSLDIIIKKYLIRIVFERCFTGLKDITKEHVESVIALFDKSVGKSISLPQGIKTSRTYDKVVIGTKDFNTYEKVVLPDYTQSIIEWQSGKNIEKNDYTKYFDYDKIKGNVELRTRRTGDYIVVNSTGGKKKLKDYFIDEKIPADKRDMVPVFAVESHIMWVVGYRISEAFKVTDQTTKVLQIDICTEKEEQ